MKIITINVDGVEVRGEINHRCSSDIDVTILSPFQNISSGLHIPYFSRHHSSFETELGDTTAESLLKNIYKLCLEIMKNKDVLKLKYKEYELSKKRIETEIDELIKSNDMIHSGKMLKSNELPKRVPVQVKSISKREI